MQARRAGMLTNDSLLGLAGTGHMTRRWCNAGRKPADRASRRSIFIRHRRADEVLTRLMPDYDHIQEQQALLTTTVPAGVLLSTYTGLRYPPAAGLRPRIAGVRRSAYRKPHSPPITGQRSA